MRILIVEDEPLQAKRLKKLLIGIDPSVSVITITESVDQTVNYLTNNTLPDLILMDIELADGQSFEIFNQIEINTPVIFTTAYDEYALRAFKVNSIDYLLKPVNEEELKKALIKFKKTIYPPNIQKDVFKLIKELQENQSQENVRRRFLVKNGNKMSSIDINEVAYLFSDNGFSFLRTHQNHKYLIEHTLDDLELNLPPVTFFRANRKFILSNKCIINIHSWFNQKLKVEVLPITEEHIIVSRDKAHHFKKWMGE